MQQQQADKQRPRWKRWTALKRRLIVILLSVILSCTALSIAVALIAAKSGSVNTVARATDTLPPKAEACLLGPLWRSPNRQTKTAVLNISNDVCETATCREAASMILENADDTVDPCENFYRFACGGLINSTALPKNANEINYSEINKKNALKRLRLAFEEESQPNEPHSIRQYKIFYKSCMNTHAIENRGLSPLRTALRNLGGWPVIDGDSWNETNFDWSSLYPKLIKEGYKETNILPVQSSENGININVVPLYLGLSRRTMEKGSSDETVNAYFDNMVEIATMLGADKPQAQKELNASLAFEIELAKIDRRRDKSYRIDLTQETPLSNWTQVNETLIRMFKPLVPVKTGKSEISFNDPYTSNIVSLINKTPKRTVANFLMWRVVLLSLPFLGESMNKKHRDRVTKLTGIMWNPSRWEECLEMLFQHNPIIVGSIYEKKYVLENRTEMIENLKAEVEKEKKKIYGQTDRFWWSFWSSAGEAITDNDVSYEKFLYGEKVEAIYKNIAFSEDEYFENYLKATRVLPDFCDEMRNRLRGTSLENWSADILSSISLLIMFSNSRLYKLVQRAYNRPNYMNYATSGFTIFDHHVPSNVKPLRCFIDQYSNFTLEKFGLKVNNSDVDKRHFIDNLSIKIAYSAYNDWVATNGKEKKLPGIDRTPMQLFWISYANQFCEVYPSEYFRNSFTSKSAILPEFRVLGPLTNMPEFARDFTCPVGSKMNPKQRCSFS